MSGSVAFDPYTPLNVLKPIAAGVWIVDGPEIQFNYLGLKFPFPTRMTLIRLPDGGLWIHSPTSLTDALAGQVLQAGPVQFLIAPNTLHLLVGSRLEDALSGCPRLCGAWAGEIGQAPASDRSCPGLRSSPALGGNHRPSRGAWRHAHRDRLLPLPVTHPSAHRPDRELRAETDAQPNLSAFAAPHRRRRS